MKTNRILLVLLGEFLRLLQGWGRDHGMVRNVLARIQMSGFNHWLWHSPFYVSLGKPLHLPKPPSAFVCSVTQSCPILCDPMDCSSPDSSMEFSGQEYWSGLPFPSPGESSQPRDQTCISCIGRQIRYHWATWETSILSCKMRVISSTTQPRWGST